MIQKLIEITAEVRRDRLESEGYDPEKAPIDALVGDCHYNAYELCDRLYHEGMNPHLVWGYHTIDDGKPGHREDRYYEHAREINFQLHYWVEVDGIVCEVSEHPTGEIKVSESQPETYSKARGSVIDYSPEIEMTDLGGYKWESVAEHALW